ncbi:MAG TPA: ABC transporter permease [Candidatus Limnocylindria bacterium]
MGRYVARRLIQAIPLLLGITVMVFAILKAIPGGPLAAYEANPNVTPEDMKRLEHALGLDQPVPIQYASWLGHFLTGDWGFSHATSQPVLTMIGGRLPNTLWLMATVYVVTLLIALPIGVLTAVKQYSWFDHITTGATFAAFSMPTFWLGLLLIITFGLTLRLLPLGGMLAPGAPFTFGDLARHLVLPVATLSLVQIGVYVRFLRASMLETTGQDYMRTARSKGLSEPRVIWRHALKNAAIPFITVAALDLPELFVGAVVTEQIFGWPGMGRLFIDSATRLDYPVLMGIIAISAAFVVLANLLADIVYGYLDPRIRYS